MQNRINIKALKHFQWCLDDPVLYEAGNIYEVEEKKAQEMITHGYAEAEEIKNKSKKSFKAEEKETKVVIEEEDKAFLPKENKKRSK